MCETSTAAVWYRFPMPHAVGHTHTIGTTRRISWRATSTRRATTTLAQGHRESPVLTLISTSTKLKKKKKLALSVRDHKPIINVTFTMLGVDTGQTLGLAEIGGALDFNPCGDHVNACGVGGTGGLGHICGLCFLSLCVFLYWGFLGEISESSTSNKNHRAYCILRPERYSLYDIARYFLRGRRAWLPFKSS